VITKSNGIIFQPIHHLNYWKMSKFFLNNYDWNKNWMDRFELCLLRPKESVPNYFSAIDAPSEPGAVSLVVVAAGGSKSEFHTGLKLLQSTILFLPLA
jgi:hypothetical protein